MKKGIIITVIFLSLTIGNTFAKSFVIEGKTINLIDFSGYKHTDTVVIGEYFKSFAGIEVKDALYQNKEDTKYNSFFAVGYIPKMQMGHNWTKKEFAFLKDELNKELPKIINTQALRNEFKGKLFKDIEDISNAKPIIDTDYSFGYSTIVKYEELNFPVLSFMAYALINEKIVSINHYDDYQMPNDYEIAKTRFIKFVNAFMQANGQSGIISNKTQSEVPKKQPLQKSEIQDILSDSLNKLINKDVLTYSSLSNPNKNGGLSFTIKYPKDYKSEEGERPHILKKFTSPADKNGFQLYLSVQVDKLPDDFAYLKEQELEELAEILFSNMKKEDYFPSTKAEILFSQTTKYERQPGNIVIAVVEGERAALKTTSLMGTQQIIYKNYLIIITTAYYSLNRRVSFEEYKSYFDKFFFFNSQIGNSLIINNKY